MNWTRTIGCAAAAAGLWAGTCLGGNIGAWSLTANLTGTTDFEEAVTVNNVLGNGVTVSDPASKGLNASSWGTGSTVDANRYFECSVTAKSGVTLSVEGVNVSLRASKTGPTKVQMRYSTDGGSTWTTVHDGDFEADTYDHDCSQTFTATSTGTFKFRIYGYAAGAGTGTFRINADSLKILGTAASASSKPVVTLEDGILTWAGKAVESAVRVMPAVAGTTTNAVLDPAPAGAYSLAGGKFTFTPAAADAGAAGTEYTLTVTAVNANGSGSAETSVFVMPELPAGSYLTGFEKLPVESLSGETDIDGLTWTAQSASVVANTELKAGTRCLGFSRGGAYLQTTTKVLGSGVGAVGFLAWKAGEEGYDVFPLEVSVSENGTDWTSVGALDLADLEGRQSANISVELAAPVYVRIQAAGEGSMRYLDLDNLWISPFVDTTTDYEKFLLKYNVTPGDDLTGEDEDYDGDGYSNGAEWTADTDPYDETVHP